MRILVTGGGGFVGTHLVEGIKQRGWEPIIFDRRNGGDILTSDLNYRVENCDVVIHLAGILGSCETFANIAHVLDTNIMGSLNVLEACRSSGVPVVLMCTPQVPWYNPYLISKRCVTELGHMYHDFLGTKVGLVRAFNIYGPGQHWGRVCKAVPTFIVKALQGENLTIYGDGSQSVDLIHVSDVCEIILRTIERECYGVEIEAGTGVETSVLELAGLILTLANDTSPAIVFEPMRPGEPSHSFVRANPFPMLEHLHYTPKVQLEQGMADTIDWYREHMDEVKD